MRHIKSIDQLLAQAPVNVKQYLSEDQQAAAEQETVFVYRRDWKISPAIINLQKYDESYGIVYIVRDEKGTVLKVGKTTPDNIDDSFKRYWNSREYTGRIIAIDCLPVKVADGEKVTIIESKVREKVENDDTLKKQEEFLAWDGMRKGGLGHPGGVPGVDTSGMRHREQTWKKNEDEVILNKEEEVISSGKNGPAVGVGSLVKQSQRPEQTELEGLLRTHKGVQARVARELGVSEMTVSDWIRSYGINTSSYRTDEISKETLEEALKKAGNVNALAAKILGVNSMKITRLRKKYQI